MEPLTPEQKVELQQLLWQHQSILTDLLEQIKCDSSPVTLDQTLVGRVSRIDAIQQQQMAKANLASSTQRLRQIVQALARIDDGDYGMCLACDEPIDYRRLKIQPETAYCVACQEEIES